MHKSYAVEEEYLEACSELTYSDHVRTYSDLNDEFKFQSNLRFGKGLPQSVLGLLQTRPAKAELHPRFREFGDITFQFPLDFGSYRDLQRHRSAVQPMPILSTRHGFDPWYLDQLTDDLRRRAFDVLEENDAAIADSGLVMCDKQ